MDVEGWRKRIGTERDGKKWSNGKIEYRGNEIE